MLETNLKIEMPRSINKELIDAIFNLLPQLTKIERSPSNEYLEAILTSDTTSLLIARDPGDETGVIVAMLTLVFIKILSGMYAQIEDVVVDSKYRRRGIGRKLVERAISLARENQAKQIHLTSNPSRIEANKLYLKLGFSKRNTNVYFLEL